MCVFRGKWGQGRWGGKCLYQNRTRKTGKAQEVTCRISASPPSALPAVVNHQHSPTITPAGMESYQEVPITITKEGRMSSALGVGRAGEDKKGILSGGSVLLRSKQCYSWRRILDQSMHAHGTLSKSSLSLGLSGQRTFQCTHPRALGF